MDLEAHQPSRARWTADLEYVGAKSLSVRRRANVAIRSPRAHSVSARSYSEAFSGIRLWNRHGARQGPRKAGVRW
jgi:hypothetical protein